MPSVSFEFFPPRNDQSLNTLQETVAVLSAYQPEFQSVTYGAGGSKRDGTLATLDLLAKSSASDVASHLTFTGSKASEVAEFADELWNKGIRRVVALRGDSRKDGSPEVFKSTAQFIQTLKRHHPFEIVVSCYPETHPLAESPEADIAILKEKQDAGASLAISQFFFDNSVFYDFVARARAAGVTIPIVPGILPVYDFARVCKIAEECGASLPGHFKAAFETSDTSGEGDLEVAAELLKAQVHDLAVAGYEAIHIYTLNRPELAAIAAGAFYTSHRERLVA